MSAPTIQVLIGFQTTAGFGTPFQLDNATYGKLDTGTLGGFQMVDLTDQCQSISINRGRNRQTEQFTAGTASLRFRDPDRDLDPLNTASPYYPFLTPRAPVQILAAGVPIYTGLVADWDLDYSLIASASTTTVSCADAFTVLANQSLDAWTPTSQGSGARVAAVLTRPEIIFQGATSIATGMSTLGAYAVADGTNALGYLQSVTNSEQGFLFVDAAGTLVFAGRETALNPVASLTFTENGSAVPYMALTNDFGDALLYNYIQTQSPAGAVQIASDATSIALYQAQQLTLLDLLNSTTAEVGDLGDYLLGRYKDPQLRFTGLDVQLAAMTAGQQATVLSADLTDVASVQKSFSVGSPTSVVQTLIVSGITHTITPGTHRVRFTFEATDGNLYFTLDDAVFGVLDTNLLAF